MNKRSKIMKIIVMSDSHNSFFSLNKIFFNYHADLYLHLGDGERELNQIAIKYPEKQILHVKGNCDLMSFSEDELIFSPDDKYTVFAVHGHKYNVKHSLEPLKTAARKKGADILLYGHTHERFCSYEDGLYIMNPGSVSCPRNSRKPSFGIIELTDSGIMTNIIDL